MSSTRNLEATTTLTLFYRTDASGIHSLEIPYRPEANDGRLSQAELDQIQRQHQLPNGAAIVGVEIEGRSYVFDSVRPVNTLPAVRFAR